MQSDWKEIYRLTAERTGKSEQLYKDVGNFIFSELYRTIRRPPSLIIKLRGVGSWFLRKQRMEILINVFPPDYNKTFKDNFFTPLAILQHENKKEIYELFIERMKEYEQYVEERRVLKEYRKTTQHLLTPKKDENE